MDYLNEKAPCAEQHQLDQILKVAMLQPRFENFPKELLSHDQWVVWKDKKIPYDPTRLNSKAKVKDCCSWGLFYQADAAYNEVGWFSVVTYKCIIDGIPKLVLVQLSGNMGAACIEHSPSGSSLLAFEFANQSISGIRDS